MGTTATFVAGPLRGLAALGACITPLRLASVTGLWGVIGFIHATEAPAAVVWMAVAMAAGLGLAMVLLAADDTRWTSVLAAAVLLATNPALQQFWVPPEDPAASDALSHLKTLLILAGLLLLARLEAGQAERGEADAGGAGL